MSKRKKNNRMYFVICECTRSAWDIMRFCRDCRMDQRKWYLKTYLVHRETNPKEKIYVEAGSKRKAQDVLFSSKAFSWWIDENVHMQRVRVPSREIQSALDSVAYHEMRTRRDAIYKKQGWI